MAPPNIDYKSYHRYIDELLPPESPILYGLHMNAEIDTLTTRSENLFQTLMEMQPRDASSMGGLGISREDKVNSHLVCIQYKMFIFFNIFRSKKRWKVFSIKYQNRSTYQT